MIHNYLKIAWRSLLKHKAFSFINIIGLAVGITAFGLIALYVTDEWSYDRYNTKADRIFRVAQHGQWQGGKFDIAVTSPPYAPTLKSEFPQVVEACRIDAEGGSKIVYGNKSLEEGSILFADNSIFSIFSYNFLSGDATKALNKPNTVVLTESLAKNLFGDAGSATGKMLQMGDTPTEVTGVIADVPVNSHFAFKALRAFPAGYFTGYNNSWGNSNLYTYLLLKNQADAKEIEASGNAFFNRHVKSELGPMKFTLELQPLTDIHLRSNLSYELGANGNITYVYAFGITAILILVIAIINYVNLTTARSSVRVREIAVRKVVGSDRGQLVTMFFTECVLLTIVAAAVAACLIQIILPYFNQLSGKTLTLFQYGKYYTIAIFGLFAVITGLLSGIYPALFLSGFKTIPAMKGQMGNQLATIFFRKSLVVFQFVVTIVLIVGSCVIYQQLNYFQNKDLGFNKAQTLTFHINNREVRGRIDALKQALLQNPHIEAVAVAGNPIGNNNIGGGDFNLGPDGKPNADSKIVQNLQIDEDFIPAMQIRMAAGRNFSKNITSDVNDAIIVNETLVKELGWKNPIGRKVRTGLDDKGNVLVRTVVGVVKDFNTYSLQHKIAPIVMEMPAEAKDKDNFYVRIAKGDVKASLNYITATYSGFDLENKPEFHFLDQNFAAQYQTEQKQGTILLIFTILAISIACLGLFGLVTFTAGQRVKEIGIRKVLGASVTSIVRMLSTDLIRLVGIAIIISVPIAWFAMDRWLQNFAYKIQIQWWVFILAGLGATVVALVTVSVQSIKAALANPAKTLKDD
ncbi:FtsX-like permease family protein [Mucilaginibacter achroorhodeus]|uniref:FtsX-like permease family protein n=1 Tax=Mucilaginibacter achroorhodeus TaxID=2599294 RepID=A0A563U3X6_9SPHI|nr:ABC transporter permease [Mucilaginibacter achroorhodeus]TWR26057.1 FtsX-like permease family protein [Mucilaginibacter achroorhodeus]